MIKKEIDELCLAGACNRGICYIGSMKKLEELNILKLKKIVGVSIGAFVGLCYVVGFTSDELLEIIIEKDMKEFKDISLSEHGAVLKGEKYRKWVYDVLSKKIDPNITFLELYNKTKIEFTCVTTCIYSSNNNFSEGIVYLSKEYSPDMPIIMGINCSMAFPFIFPPVSYKDCLFIDGGLLNNLPIDKISEKGLAIKVNFKPIDGLTSTRNPVTYVGKLFEIISEHMLYLANNVNNNTRKNIITITCDDFDLIDFDMSIDDKITLYKRGYTAIEKWV